MRIQEFSSGGSRSVWQKKALTFFFLVLSLFYWIQMVNFKEIYHFSRGGPTFSSGGGGGGGGGESNCLFPVETHITCDFPGGGPDPLSPPLDPHLLLVLVLFINKTDRQQSSVLYNLMQMEVVFFLQKNIASFGTFVSRTLPCTAYRCTVFFDNSQTLVCRSNERFKKFKSVNLLFLSPCLCSSNRKKVQLNTFSLSSLISRIRKSVVWCCLQYPISFSPFN